MYGGVFARLEIQTDIMNAVQHIKKVVITADGTAGWEKLIELNSSDNPITGSIFIKGNVGIWVVNTWNNGEVLKVKWNMIVWEVDGVMTNKAEWRFASVWWWQSNYSIWDFTKIWWGFSNTINWNHWFIGWWRFNSVSWTYAVIPWWAWNKARWKFTFAAWYKAETTHDWTFIRSDPSNPGTPFTSTTGNQFLIRAANGVGINTNITTKEVAGVDYPLGALVMESNDINEAIAITNGATNLSTRMYMKDNVLFLNRWWYSWQWLKIKTDWNFIIWDSYISTDSDNSIAIWQYNYIKWNSNWCTIWGWFEQTILDCYHSTIWGGRNNTINADAHNSVIAWWTNNLVDWICNTIWWGTKNIVNWNHTTIGWWYMNIWNWFWWTIGWWSSNIISWAASYWVIAGWWGNMIEWGVGNTPEDDYATIWWWQDNLNKAWWGTIAGWKNNEVRWLLWTIGGWFNNYTNDGAATIAGGSWNIALAESFVWWWEGNTASWYVSIIWWWMFNIAWWYYSTIPWGYDNEANGFKSFAAWNRAKANHIGSFVRADSTNSDFASYWDNTFNVRAEGWTRIYNDVGYMSFWAWDTSRSYASDRNLKENFQEIDKQKVLDQFAVIPVTQRNYISDEAEIQNYGFMVQDFNEYFDIWNDDLRLSTQEVDWVIVVALQALTERNTELETRVADLENKLEQLLQ